MSKQIWVVRAGHDAMYVEDFLKNNMVAIGWDQLGDLRNLRTREQVAQAVAKAYPEYSKSRLAINAGQIYRFLWELVQGETVLTYDPGNRVYHLGTVDGDYAFQPMNDPELRHTRAVKWRSTIERDRLSAATKNSLGSIAAVFCISEAASDEVAALTTSESSSTPEMPTAQGEKTDDEVALLEDTEERARQFLQDRLDRLSWDQMQELVAGLLRAMGYRTRVSPPGPDGGRDILASPDALGFVSPRIIAEVKHRKGAVGAPQVRSFMGGLRNQDSGLYVSTGGFTREARYEAHRANHVLTLMDSTDLAETIIENYDRMDLETRTLLPLKKIYWPE